MKQKLIYTFFLLSVLFTVYGNNVEHIPYFHSDIVIDSTGRVEITESITVYAEGNNIRRGIVRSIPVYRKDNAGKKKNIDFKILSVQRDDVNEPYHTETTNGNKEIFIGSSDVLLKPGIYKYTIVYETYGHIGFFDSYDELYWNITGNDWAFRIDKASVTVTLPEGSAFINAACYTGTYGESNNDCSFQEENGKYTFQAKNKLEPKEGFTIGIAFTPNIIKRPPPPTLLEMFWEKYGYLVYAVFALTILGCYYIFTWRKVGKDPEKHIVVPIFDPPNGWSATTVRRLYKKEHDKKVLTIALIEMAIRRLIRIRQESKKTFFEKKEYILEKLTTEENDITSQDKRILNKLFPGKKNTLTVSNKNYENFAGADLELNSLFKYTRKDIFRHNYRYAVLGLFMALLVMVPYLCLFTSTETVLIVLFTFIFFLIGSIIITQVIFGIMKQSKVTGFVVGIPSVVIGLFLQQKFFLTMQENILLYIFILLVQISLPIYFCLIKAPTQLGLQIEASLEGFRMYLKAAEENRLNLLTPPDRTPELFEKLLPYAIALDVENEWGKKFNQVLKQANYSPDWYQGTSSFHTVGFVTSFSNSFNNSIRRAKINPESGSNSGSGDWGSGSSSWSSGSSGGGFSGGGGGGGGGRGW